MTHEFLQSNTPLTVDLDGTLSRTDTLLEALLLLLKQDFLATLLMPFWLLQGKAKFKQKISEHIVFDANGLVYNADVIDYIEKARLSERRVYLVTGADEAIATAVNEHLGLFDGVFCSDGEVNLTGSRKLAKLQQHFSEGFEYVGNSSVDLEVWAGATVAMVVSPKVKLVEQAKLICQSVQSISVEKPSFKSYVRAVRVHQWVKNALIFVPLFTAHLWQDANVWITGLLGFLSFSLAASSVYVLNDLLDLNADRQHSSKSKRPFAAGLIPLEQAILLFPVFFISAFALTIILPIGFLIGLSAYYLMTVAYSFSLKRIVMLDTVVLAALYTMRIIAGTLLVAADFSFWLLSFSMFIFLSLALLKRYIELVHMRAEGKTTAIGRGYHSDDATMVSSLGTASGFIAVLVMALYVHSPEVQLLYETEQLLWLICPILLYWISRAWLIAHRNEMNDDPIVFAVKDKQSLFTGLVVATVFYLSTLSWGV